MSTPGMLVARREGDKIRILQADPWIRIASEFVDGVRHLTHCEIDGLVVRFWDDFGAAYTYRLGPRDPLTGEYPAEWPD